MVGGLPIISCNDSNVFGPQSSYKASSGLPHRHHRSPHWPTQRPPPRHLACLPACCCPALATMLPSKLAILCLVAATLCLQFSAGLAEDGEGVSQRRGQAAACIMKLSCMVEYVDCVLPLYACASPPAIGVPLRANTCCLVEADRLLLPVACMFVAVDDGSFDAGRRTAPPQLTGPSTCPLAGSAHAAGSVSTRWGVQFISHAIQFTCRVPDKL